jgi:hypothetical protein
MLEAANTSKTPVHFYQATGRYNPEDSRVQPLRCSANNSFGFEVLIPMMQPSAFYLCITGSYITCARP